MSGYFDRTYFDGTYFDTGATVGGGARYPIPIIPDARPTDDEQALQMLLDAEDEDVRSAVERYETVLRRLMN